MGITSAIDGHSNRRTITNMHNQHIFAAAVAAMVVMVLAAPVAFAVRATVKSLSVPSGAVSAGVPIILRWQSANFPANGKIDINVMRQISQTPRSFVLVRQIAQGIANTGSATWTPSSGDIGGDMYAQIGCSSLSTFPEGCASEDALLRLTAAGNNSSIAEAATQQSLASTIASLQNLIAALMHALHSQSQ